jgi:hypothetical protein
MLLVIGMDDAVPCAGKAAIIAKKLRMPSP